MKYLDWCSVIDGNRMVVRAIGEGSAGEPALTDIIRYDPHGAVQTTPIEVLR